MKRIAESILTGLVLTTLLIVSFAWSGRAATAHAAPASRENSAPAANSLPASVQQQTPVTLSVDLEIETDAQRFAVPLMLDMNALLAQLGEESLSAFLNVGPALTNGEIQTITLSFPSLFTPTRAAIVITPSITPPPVSSPEVTSTVFVNIPSPSTVTTQANLRTGPSVDFDAVALVGEGQTVVATARNADGSWYLLDDGNWIVAAVLENAPQDLPIYIEGVGTIAGSVPATVTSRALTLRAGPSLDDVRLGFYENGAVVAVTGKALGDIWAQVVTPDGNLGWMSLNFLSVAVPIEEIPIVRHTASAAIKGVVVDDAGEPINGIVIAATQEGEPETLRVDDTSTPSGDFFLFLPEESSGAWTVSAAGIECNSRIIGENCRLGQYYIVTPTVEIELPQEEPLTFVYVEAASFIIGEVVDSDGNPVEEGIGITAEREDGAQSSAVTSTAGEFSLPAAPGIWTVTVDEGTRTTVEIAEDGAPPEPLEIVLE